MKLKLFLCAILAFTSWLALAAKPDKPVHKVKVNKVLWHHGKPDKLAEDMFGVDVKNPKSKWMVDTVSLWQKGKVSEKYGLKSDGDEVEVSWPKQVYDLPNVEYLLPNGKVNWAKAADTMGLTIPMVKALNPGVE